MTDGLWDGAELAHAYTRAQAIKDGVLVDLSDSPLVREAGFRLPLAMTAAAYARAVALTPAARRAGNDADGRLWDVLWVLRQAVRRTTPGEREVRFTVYAVVDRVRPTPVRLKCLCGPGDAGEPVLTVMLPAED
jgi:hypothetical protein